LQGWDLAFMRLEKTTIRLPPPPGLLNDSAARNFLVRKGFLPM